MLFGRAGLLLPPLIQAATVVDVASRRFSTTPPPKLFPTNSEDGPNFCRGHGTFTCEERGKREYTWQNLLSFERYYFGFKSLVLIWRKKTYEIMIMIMIICNPKWQNMYDVNDESKPPISDTFLLECYCNELA